MDWLTRVLLEAPSISMVCRLRMQVLSMAILFSKGQRSGLLRMLSFSIQEWLNRLVKCFLPLSTKQSCPEGIQEGQSLALRLNQARSGMKSCLQKGLALWKVSSLQFIRQIYCHPLNHFATIPQFYWMASQLNGSSYYRANPFYQQGYIPDAALRNRRPPQQHGELPQGEEFFEPTNKKHFQRVGYYSTIAEQKIIHSEDPQPSSPAKDKDYFRSLNINDIEGAATNTLISKAVKNRIKAQEELNRRAQQQREAQTYHKMKILERQQNERQRMQALSILNSHSQPNYHEKVKRMRTEEQEKMNNQMERQSQMGQGLTENYRPVEKDPIQSYREELQQADRDIRELQLQLSQVKSQKEKAQQDHDERSRNHPISQNHEYSRNIAPVTNESTNQYRSPQSNHPQEVRNENPEQYYADSLPNKFQLSPQEVHYLANERQRQQGSPEHYPNAGEGPYTQRQPSDYRRVSPGEYSQQKRGSSLPLSGRQHREQHRRFNPTFLSYGSPSIGLAGKKIVGY